MSEKIRDRGRLDSRRKMSLLFSNMRDQLLYVHVYNNYDGIKQGTYKISSVCNISGSFALLYFLEFTFVNGFKRKVKNESV
jgi:hypothetical protein